ALLSSNALGALEELGDPLERVVDLEVVLRVEGAPSEPDRVRSRTEIDARHERFSREKRLDRPPLPAPTSEPDALASGRPGLERPPIRPAVTYETAVAP